MRGSAQRSVSGAGLVWARWSGRAFEDDFVSEGFELADVVAPAAFGVDAGVVEVAAEVGVTGVGSASRCQMMTRMDRPMATTAFFLPRRRAMRR